MTDEQREEATRRAREGLTGALNDTRGTPRHRNREQAVTGARERSDRGGGP